MPSTFRIPKAELTGVVGRAVELICKRTFGTVPDVAYVAFHNKRVLASVFGFETAVERWKALDPTLKSYAEMASAAVIGCSWCLDFGYYKAQNEGLDLDKISQVPRWRESDVFTSLERDVLEYAEAMTATPPTVTDDLVARLLDALGKPAMVELTEIIGVENLRSRVNAAAGLQSQGFSDACEIPLAAPGDHAGVESPA